MPKAQNKMTPYLKAGPPNFDSSVERILDRFLYAGVCLMVEICPWLRQVDFNTLTKKKKNPDLFSFTVFPLH